nr:hypothetical protein [Bifidobacterium dentium]
MIGIRSLNIEGSGADDGGVEHANAIIDQRRHQPSPQGGPQRHRHHQGDDAIRLAGDGLTSIEILEKREYGGWDSDTDPLMRINEQGDWTGISQAQADGLVWAKREEILDHAAYDDSLSPGILHRLDELEGNRPVPERKPEKGSHHGLNL